MATETKEHAVDIHERIRRGDFDRKQSMPVKPRRPAILDKPAGLLTEADLASIPKVKAEHAELMESWRQECEAYRNAGHRLEQSFRKALLESHGMDPALPITDMLYRLAWEHGHSAVFYEVATHMHDLAAVYHEAIRMRDEAAKGGCS